jgi:hypothetical protein
MNRFAMTMTVLCVLSVPVSAGQIPSDGAASPMPPPSRTTITSATGHMPNVGFADQLSGAALSAVLSVLSLLS